MPNMKEIVVSDSGNQHELNNQCVTMCQKIHLPQRNRRQSSSRTKTMNPIEDDRILIKNLKPKCLIIFDHTASRVRPKSKHTLISSNALPSSSSSSSTSLLPSISTSVTSNSQLSANTQNDQAKKTCIESSKHILTHNGLVIKHPILKLVPTILYPKGQFEPYEGQTLPPLEFYLQLDSKNAQYFDLVLKVTHSEHIWIKQIIFYFFTFRSTNGLPQRQCCIRKYIREY